MPTMAKLRPNRLLRRLLAGGTILSLILCLATVGLWVRSYWRHDCLARISVGPDVDRTFAIRTFAMESSFGELSTGVVHYVVPSHQLPGWYYLKDSNPRDS